MRYKDILRIVSAMNDEQLEQKAQVVISGVSDDHVYECLPVISLQTINDLEIQYARSSVDNRRHGNDFVLFTDIHPFELSGCDGYDITYGCEERFPADHDESADWTGPAQALHKVISREETSIRLTKEFYQNPNVLEVYVFYPKYDSLNNNPLNLLVVVKDDLSKESFVQNLSKELDPNYIVNVKVTAKENVEIDDTYTLIDKDGVYQQ